jgi:predicted DNA-binding transcriptional regulator AlpA
MNDDTIDVRAVMALLKLGRNAVYDGCARGDIPHRRIGKLLRFSRAGLQSWLASAAPIRASDRGARG